MARVFSANDLTTSPQDPPGKPKCEERRDHWSMNVVVPMPIEAAYPLHAVNCVRPTVPQRDESRGDAVITKVQG